MELIVDKLTVVRDGRAILKELSFVVAAGQSLVLLGPNGAGKTSLLEILSGSLAPAAGQVSFDVPAAHD